VHPSWLQSIILKSALQLEAAGGARFRFAASIEEALEKNPIQDWEAALWARGLKSRLIRMEGYFFRAGTGKSSCLSFFVRNEQGLQVGLRRESITQAATYVTLITDYGFARESTRFETGWMDVAVFDKKGEAYIYAENKANEKTLQKLCGRLASEFRNGVPFFREEEMKKVDDAVMKAHHIWRHRPMYFWGVSPSHRQSFLVHYSRSGFHLETAAALPNQCEWVVDAAVDRRLFPQN
jgi:hypothetical protein